MPRPNRGPYLVFLKKRKRYYIRWTEQGRSKERSTETSDRDEAEERLAEFIRSRRKTGKARDPDKFPVIEAFEDYVAEHGVNVAAPERIGYAVKPLLSFFGDDMIGDITVERCREYASMRNVSAGTIRRDLGVLRAAINHAHRRGRISRPVFVTVPPPPEGRDRWLTRNEVAGLLRAARREPRSRAFLPLFILIGLYAGARKGAILSLRWPQVDLERARIDLNPPGRKRTNKGRPIIPIPRGLRWFLSRARENGSDLGYVINRNGKPIKDVKRSFASACQAAGLIDVTPHTLRHTAGTWMAQSGVPLWEIAGFLGHSVHRTTELYAHHHPDFLSNARKALD